MKDEDPEAIRWLREKMGGKKGGGRITTSTNRGIANQLRELDGTSDDADGGMADGGHADGDSRARKR
jgi:hypothetical protein